MKDSSKLLNFNVNRNLGFTGFRGVSFDVRRSLSFDAYRKLSFDSSRDLGFGKRGVVFRGYVCPICGAPVAKDAPNCDECGVKFEQSVKEEKKTTKKLWDREKERKPPAPMKDRSQSKPSAPAQQRKNTFQCPICGKVLYVGTSTCPGCNASFTSSTRPSAPPAAKAPPADQQVFCANCNYKIPSTDRFCRRCGSPRPRGTGNATVSWDEYVDRKKDDGIVSWDEYSRRN